MTKGTIKVDSERDFMESIVTALLSIMLAGIMLAAIGVAVLLVVWLCEGIKQW